MESKQRYESTCSPYEVRLRAYPKTERNVVEEGNPLNEERKAENTTVGSE
jgi:hypothetical protein